MSVMTCKQAVRFVLIQQQHYTHGQGTKMTTLITDRKYTVIISASIAKNDPLYNLISTERMHDRLTREYHVNPIRAIGVWQGIGEQSFVIHTNSSRVVGEIKRLGLEVYHQEAVLISNNRKHDVQLHHIDATTSHIGHGFKCTNRAPALGCYTILNGQDYWSVT